MFAVCFVFLVCTCTYLSSVSCLCTCTCACLHVLDSDVYIVCVWLKAGAV